MKSAIHLVCNLNFEFIKISTYKLKIHLLSKQFSIGRPFFLVDSPHQAMESFPTWPGRLPYLDTFTFGSNPSAGFPLKENGDLLTFGFFFGNINWKQHLQLIFNPIQAKSTPPTKLASTYHMAIEDCPVCQIWMTSKEKAEKVVNPPQKPVANNNFTLGEISSFNA